MAEGDGSDSLSRPAVAATGRFKCRLNLVAGRAQAGPTPQQHHMVPSRSTWWPQCSQNGQVWEAAHTTPFAPLGNAVRPSFEPSPRSARRWLWVLLLPSHFWDPRLNRAVSWSCSSSKTLSHDISSRCLFEIILYLDATSSGKLLVGLVSAV